MQTVQLRSAVLALTYLITCACGGAPPPEAPKPEATTAPEPEPDPTPEPKPDKPPADAPAEPEKEVTAEAKPELKGRDITYRMTPGGLVIEVEGVEFVPKAEAVKTNAGYDVALSVKATSKDGNMHRLLSPENGPLMVFAKIERAGKTTDNPDERKGDGEEFISPGDSITLERKIPAKITAGSSITLQVGLWGLGVDASERKPIRKLFWLKMAGGSKKPVPVITAPE